MSKLSRETAIDNLVELAATVLSETLTDPAITPLMKSSSLQAAINLFSAKEKFRIEDARIEIEKEQLKIQEAQLQLPGGALSLTQNNLIVSSAEDIVSRKQQAQMLLDQQRDLSKK